MWGAPQGMVCLAIGQKDMRNSIDGLSLRSAFCLPTLTDEIKRIHLRKLAMVNVRPRTLRNIAFIGRCVGPLQFSFSTRSLT